MAYAGDATASPCRYIRICLQYIYTRTRHISVSSRNAFVIILFIGLFGKNHARHLLHNPPPTLPPVLVCAHQYFFFLRLFCTTKTAGVIMRRVNCFSFFDFQIYIFARLPFLHVPWRRLSRLPGADTSCVGVGWWHIWRVDSGRHVCSDQHVVYVHIPNACVCVR